MLSYCCAYYCTMLFHSLENLEQMFYNLDIKEKGMCFLKKELIKKIVEIVQRIDDEIVLRDVLSIVGIVYKNYTLGKWGR